MLARLACFTYLTCSRASRARVLFVLPCLECSTCLCAYVLYELSVITCLTCFKNLHDWRASKNGVLRVLHKIGCLVCFIKWYAWRASKNGSLGVFHKMVCLKFLNFFLIVCVTTGHLWIVNPECEVMYSMEGRKLLNLSLKSLETLFLF